MGKGTSKSVAAIARYRSLKIVDVMGARGAQIPSIVIVAMVVILVHEEQTMRRGHPPFPAVLAPPWYSLYDVETAPTRLPPAYRWSHPSVEVPLMLRWRHN